MIDKNDRELWEEVHAREELEKRGYTRDPCPSCDGNGRIAKSFVPCTTCGGRGYHWVGPMLR